MLLGLLRVGSYFQGDSYHKHSLRFASCLRNPELSKLFIAQKAGCKFRIGELNYHFRFCSEQV